MDKPIDKFFYEPEEAEAFADLQRRKGSERPDDPQQKKAKADLEAFLEKHREEVFFSRQLEVMNEGIYFHWITNRAIRELVADGVLRRERRELATGGSITLLWHRSFRYYKRAAARVAALVEEYANPNIGGALGLQGEAHVLDGFARFQFVMHGRDARSFRGSSWVRSEHDLDFIFERDGVAYGIEVKNTLGYMDRDEMLLKIELCHSLHLRPVFAVRMLPKTWNYEIIKAGGFALIFRHQLYPWAYRELARRVADELGLPVDSPQRLADGTMQRFLDWHEKMV